MTFKEDARTTIAEGTVDDIGVASNPANVRHTGKQVTRLVVKHVL